MCGITGIVNKDGTPLPMDVLQHSNDLIKHRGPDGEGFYQYENVGLAHRRLSIIDLSADGRQPMTYDREDYVITFNGEIYNYVELKEELTGLGYVFQNKTDTEVILAAYKEWGSSCVQRFNGMWAFAILDKRQNRLFLSRDRFGIKPFYYYSDDNVFAFGSEIKQLLPLLPKVEANRQILFDYLMINMQNHTHETFFKGIHSLPNSSSVIFDLKTNQLEIFSYYTLEKKQGLEHLSEEQLIDKFEDSLSNAIRLRLRSDVKVGACLSGGMDSSAITARAAQIHKSQAHQNDFYSITAKSETKSNDESGYAELVAKRYQLDWNVTEPSYDRFKEISPNMSYVLEEPFKGASYHMQYFVMERARKDNCIVLLDGQGGDEGLLGYEIYYIPYINQLKGWLTKIKAIRAIQRFSKLTYKDILVYYFYFNFPRVKKIRFKKKAKFIRSEFSSYFNEEVLKANAFKDKEVFEIQKHHFNNFQIKNQLVFADKIAMWHSIEARFPMIDHQYVETALSLPIGVKIKQGWTKYILRKSSEEVLPKKITWRTNKLGFEAPNTWLQKKEELLEVIYQSGFIKAFADQKSIDEKMSEDVIWKLYSVAVWAKTFKVLF